MIGQVADESTRMADEPRDVQHPEQQVDREIEPEQAVRERGEPEFVAGIAGREWADDPTPLYYVMRTDWFMGIELDRGYARSVSHARFFRRARIEYRGLVHESPYVDGRKPARDADWVGALPRDWRILHRPDNDVEAEIARIGAYSVLRAKERIAAGERIGAAGVLIALLRDAVDVYRRELRNATGAAA